MQIRANKILPKVRHIKPSINDLNMNLSKTKGYVLYC